MASTTTAAGSTADSGAPFAGLLADVPSLATAGASIFQTYETASTAKKVASGLSPQTLMYVVLGLGALGIVALVVLKH